MTLATRAGIDRVGAVRLASIGAAVLSVGTILGCLAAPWLAERLGRRTALGVVLRRHGRVDRVRLRLGLLSAERTQPVHGVAAVPRLLRRQFRDLLAVAAGAISDRIRATAFAFNASVGRLLGAGVNFLLAAAIHWQGSLGLPIAWTAAAFVIGLLILPFAVETRHQTLPE